MTDLLAKLRRCGIDDAADEIERLRQQLAYAVSTGDECAIEVESLRSRLTEAESLFDADIVEIIYGPPCAEYWAECACCRAWRWVEQAK